ncbi:MAG: tRNA (N6-threonylcarbamoyladenosine(37)-N6)-methyltransferase TrmO [Candidatus Bathyarchaeota archaeon]|nr:tRNA (N6-threonylcarbamoyladenosine(37)-N6)-methyltransferase TrmO [Candidatus Bathyarchaeota archaeon]
MVSKHPIAIDPVGYVKTEAVGDQIKDKTRTSEIIIDPKLQFALDGITDYSHIYVLFWLHEIPQEKRATLKVHPRGRSDMPLVGVFAARTNLHPNPIGLTLVELVKVEGNVLTVRGLDAFNGTPVLDIKPFDSWDIAKEPRVPRWWLKLEEEKQKKL